MQRFSSDLSGTIIRCGSSHSAAGFAPLGKRVATGGGGGGGGWDGGGGSGGSGGSGGCGDVPTGAWQPEQGSHGYSADLLLLEEDLLAVPGGTDSGTAAGGVGGVGRISSVGGDVAADCGTAAASAAAAAAAVAGTAASDAAVVGEAEGALCLVSPCPLGYVRSPRAD